MSHDLNFNEENGKYAFVSNRKLAWHGLGTIVNGAMTSKEAIELAQLNYVVDKAELYAKFPSNIAEQHDKKGVIVPNSYATYRTDTLDVFGTVKGRYEVIQNSNAFNFFDSIVGEGKAIFETAGAIGKGETVFISAKLPYHIKLNGNDIIDEYLLLTMSHDGTSSIQVMFTPIRVVCNNTLSAAISGSNHHHKVNIRHTKSAHSNLKLASSIMGLSSTIHKDMSELITTMSKTKITSETRDSYINNLFLTSDELTILARNNNRIDYIDEISTRKANMVKAIKLFAEIGVGQQEESTKGTLFGAYSAITGWQQNIKGFTDDSKMMKNIYLGTDYSLNTKALNSAIDLIR